jgi:acyl-coenzyme A synthetase/AMP-(fatty) acid ligase
MLDHRYLVCATESYAECLQLGSADRVANPSSVAFIGAFRGSLATLSRGGTFHAVPLRELDRLPEVLAREGITVFHSPCSVLRHLLASVEPDQPLPALTRFYTGGEPLYRADVERWQQLFPAARLVLSFGLTECDIVLCLFVDRSTRITSEIVPVSHDVGGARVVLWDEAGRPVPVGEVGEIVAHSDHLAMGYWRNPELTAARFPPDPERPGRRVCRTGDLGRFRPDGVLDYLGRTDFQVKVRGNLVAPAEVEAALREIPGVDEVALVARPDAGGENALAAYLVMERGAEATVTELRQQLARTLPAYMIPAAFAFLEAMPLTPNGKLDRAALPDLDGSRPRLATAFVAPRTPVEKELAAIWCEVLGQKQVGVHDHFLDLGGNSLLATRVVSRAARRLATDVPAADLLRATTVAAMAELVTAQLTGELETDDAEQLLAGLQDERLTGARPASREAENHE